MNHLGGATRDRRLELAVGRVLRLGIMASSVCLAAGLMVTLVGGGDRIGSRLLTTGLIILLATPVARVVVSIVDYLLERDWLFVVITFIVLIELVSSVVAAVYGVGR
jgi:uncharacterized membrane protein